MCNSVYRGGGNFTTLSRFKIWGNRKFKKLFLSAVALMEGLAAHLPQLLESPLNWELGRRPRSWWGSRKGGQGRRRWVLFRSPSRVALSYCPLSALCQWRWRKPLGIGKPSHPPSVGMMAEVGWRYHLLFYSVWGRLGPRGGREKEQAEEREMKGVLPRILLHFRFPTASTVTGPAG